MKKKILFSVIMLTALLWCVSAANAASSAKSNTKSTKNIGDGSL
ncbi:MAG: hypothetical protein WB290_13695 [Smithella sp.]